MSSQRIIELEKLIPIYSKMYYEGVESDESGLTPISDEEFDNLVDELKDLSPDHPLILAVGFDYNIGSDKQKVDHCFVPVTGINHKTKSDVFNKGLSHKEGYVLTPKLDGCSIILTYKAGILTKALTRGTGIKGSNVIDIIKQLSSVPKVLKLKIDIVTSGELINIADPEVYGNIRNQSNGYVMRKGHTVTEDEDELFKFVPYRVLSKSLTKMEELQLLKECGFIECPWIKFDEFHEIDWESKKVEVIEQLTSTTFEGKLLPIDGIVVELDDHSSQETEVSPFNRKTIAFKLNSSSAETTVIGIRWKLSQYGKFFPTILLDKVVLDGANVSKCSGGSYKDLVNQGLGIGAKVVVVRSGGVIPYITEVLEKSNKIDAPENSYLDGAHLFSSNFSVSEMRLVRNIFKRHIPHGYSNDLFIRFSDKYPELMDSLVKFREFIDSDHIITLDREFITTRKQLDALNETFDSIRNYKIDLIRLLSLCSIDGLGPKLNKKLSTKYMTIEEFMDAIRNGELIYKWSNRRVQDSVNENIDNIEKMFDFFKSNERNIREIEVVDESQAELPKVLLTNLSGSSLKKAEIQSKFKDKFKFVGDVKNADLVIFGKEGSSKYDAAVKLNKTLIQVEDFIQGNS
jgi:DNA ligase (NAD+)